MSSATSKQGTIGLQQFLDSKPMGRRQYAIIVIAFITLLVDGIDVTAASFVYPQIKTIWGTEVSVITLIVTLGTIGMALGALAGGPIADRVGRKIVVIVAVTLFGVMTVLCGFAPNEMLFLVFRVLACIGLGAVLPLVLTMVAEFMPLQRRAIAVTIAFTGFATGLAIGGYFAGAVVPFLGWEGLMIISGLVPLVVVPIFASIMPESPTWLALVHAKRVRIEKALKALAPEADLSTIDLAVTAQADSRSNGLATILSRKYLATSILLWICYFVGLGVIYLLLNYLPLMVTQAGLSISEAGVMVGTFGWGTIVGSLLIGIFQARFGRFLAVAVAWALGIACVWTVAGLSLSQNWLLVLVFATGFFYSAANTGMQANAAMSYPVEARATGVAWMSGVGRLGNVASGILGGLMIGAGWAISTIFFTLGFPTLLGIAAVLGLGAVTRRKSRRGELPTPDASANAVVATH